MHLLCVIPARLGSTRLPDKPLQLVSGEPLIRRVVRNALQLALDADIVVATDDRRVIEVVADLAPGVLTRPDHPNGTSRVAEAAGRPEFRAYDLVLNLQGDEPFATRGAALGAVHQVRRGADIGTAAQPLAAPARRDPHRVKVVVDGKSRARRFYRTEPAPACGHGGAVFQHVGVYAYRRAALERWMALPPVPDEERDRLEQLRPLAYGMTIGVACLPEAVPHGIDTPMDLRLAEAQL